MHVIVLFLESDKSVHCPSIYHLDLDCHIDIERSRQIQWLVITHFFIFARLPDNRWVEFVDGEGLGDGGG